MLRANLDRGLNVGIGSLSITAALNDPQYVFFAKAFEDGIARLKIKPDMPFVVASDDADIT
jgi:hypothetical protein